MEFSIENALRVAKEAARSAGDILRDMLETAVVSEKAPKDLVTDADVAAQNCIESKILSAFPNHRFLGEESIQSASGPSAVAADDWLWVVDPLDGTVNYVHRMPNFAVSIALMKGDTTLLGVVFDPMADEMYTAIQGQGAFINDRKLQCSGCTTLESALVAVSFPPQIKKDSVEITQFIEILIRSQSLRRMGSAALNLCYVAHGRLDAYWAGFLKIWDIAAGGLIVLESGAMLTKQDGSRFDPRQGELIAASSNALGAELQKCLQSVRADHLQKNAP